MLKSTLPGILSLLVAMPHCCLAETTTPDASKGKTGNVPPEQKIMLGPYSMYTRQEDLEIQLRLVQENSYAFFDENHYALHKCSLQTLYLLGTMGHSRAKQILARIDANRGLRLLNKYKGMSVFEAITERFYGINQTGDLEFGRPIGASKAEMPPQLILHWEKLLKLDLEAIIEL